jgi:hypothetical protein
MLKIFSIRANKHISHEQSMVGTSADNSNFDLVLLVPSCKSVDDVDSISCVQVVNGSLTVDSPDLLQEQLANEDQASAT